MSMEDGGPITAARVVRHLGELSHQLGEITEKLNQADVEAVHARENHTQAYWRAFLSAEGSMDIRRGQATLDTEDSRLAAEAAEATVRGYKRQVDTLRARIDIGRSYSATLRAEAGLAASGSTP